MKSKAGSDQPEEGDMMGPKEIGEWFLPFLEPAFATAALVTGAFVYKSSEPGFAPYKHLALALVVFSGVLLLYRFLGWVLRSANTDLAKAKTPFPAPGVPVQENPSQPTPELIAQASPSSQTPTTPSTKWNRMRLTTRQNRGGPRILCKLWVTIENRSGEDVLIIARGVEYVGNPIRAAANAVLLAGERFKFTFQIDQSGTHDVPYVILKPGESTTTFAPIDESHSVADVDRSIADRNVATFHFGCCWLGVDRAYEEVSYKT